MHTTLTVRRSNVGLSSALGRGAASFLATESTGTVLIPRLMTHIAGHDINFMNCHWKANRLSLSLCRRPLLSAGRPTPVEIIKHRGANSNIRVVIFNLSCSYYRNARPGPRNDWKLWLLATPAWWKKSSFLLRSPLLPCCFNLTLPLRLFRINYCLVCVAPQKALFKFHFFWMPVFAYVAG